MESLEKEEKEEGRRASFATTSRAEADLLPPRYMRRLLQWPRLPLEACSSLVPEIWELSVWERTSWERSTDLDCTSVSFNLFLSSLELFHLELIRSCGFRDYRVRGWNR